MATITGLQYDTMVKIGGQLYPSYYVYPSYHIRGNDLLIDVRDAKDQVTKGLPEPFNTVARESTPVGFIVRHGSVLYPVNFKFGQRPGRWGISEMPGQ